MGTHHNSHSHFPFTRISRVQKPFIRFYVIFLDFICVCTDRLQASTVRMPVHMLLANACNMLSLLYRLKHVGIVRLRQEVNDADKLGINNSDSMPAQDSPRPPLSDSSGSKSRSTKGKHDSLPSYNNYFRLCVMANIVGADGTYFHSMSESVKCGKVLFSEQTVELRSCCSPCQGEVAMEYTQPSLIQPSLIRPSLIRPSLIRPSLIRSSPSTRHLSGDVAMVNMVLTCIEKHMLGHVCVGACTCII